MSKIHWIKRFEPLSQSRLLETVYETTDWLDQYSHSSGDKLSFDVLPGKEVEEGALLLSDKGLYGGAAGCASALLSLSHYIGTEGNLPPYLEDPYQNLYTKA